jgi:hypothetical protein
MLDISNEKRREKKKPRRNMRKNAIAYDKITKGLSDTGRNKEGGRGLNEI